MGWLTVLFHAISLPDFLGHLFYITILTGTILVGNKNKVGWLFRIAGDIGWIIVGWYIGMTSIVVWSSIFTVNELRNYLRWRLDENIKRKIEGPGVTEVRSSKDKRGVRPAGAGRGKPADGFPGCGHNAQCNCSLYYTDSLRVQKHEDVPKPKRTRTSKTSRKSPGVPKRRRRVETPEKGV